MKKRRGRPKKTSGQQLAGSKEQKGIPPLPQEAPPRTWTTAITNLALVIAILTIIFAMHKGMQRQRAVSEEQPVTSEQLSVISDQELVDQPFDTAQSKQPVISEQPAPRVSTEPQPRSEIEGSSVISDQATTEQQDSMKIVEAPQVEPIKKTPTKTRTARLEDLSNKWNSGGEMDLDSEAARQVYQQQNLLPSKK